MTVDTKHYFPSLALGITALICLTSVHTLADTTPDAPIYAIVVANNVGLDGESPLSFADNDGAKYVQLLQAAGAHVQLLTVLDERTKNIFPAAASMAVLPTGKNLNDAIDRTFRLIQRDAAAGRETHFVFMYSGHGGVGPNQEGYISLLRERFYRRDLFHRVLAPSPATYNHLVFDACNAYYFVKKRGEQVTAEGDNTEAMKRFLSAEDLRQYPNTGVILATSSESETHEWSVWEAGVFSHELRSAVLGSADIDGDGEVTYREAASCVEAANAAVDQPKARLRVFYQAPAINGAVPLMGIQSIDAKAVLHFPASFGGKYHVEDSNGIRVVDLNYSTEQPVRIALLGSAPFFIRTQNREAVLASGETIGDIGVMTFSQKEMNSRGSVAESFRRHLFTIPFGRGFYQGAMAAGLGLNMSGAPALLPSDTASPKQSQNQGQVPQPTPPATVETPRKTGPEILADKSNRSLLKTTGWILIGTGLAAGACGGIVYGAAARNHDRFMETSDTQLEEQYKTTSQNLLSASRVLFVGAGVIVATGVWMLVAGHRNKQPLRGGVSHHRLLLQPGALQVRF